MTPSRLSLTFLLTFLSSTFVLQWWQSAHYPLELWLGIGILIALCLIGSLQEETRTPSVWMLAIALGAALAFWCVTRTTHRPTAQTVDWYARGRSVIVRGVIADEPDRRPLQTRYTVEAHLLSQSGSVSWLPVSGRILVTDRNGWPAYQYGDSLIIHGRLEQPKNSETFRYDRYLSLTGIYAVMNAGAIERQEFPPSWSPFAVLYAFKDRFEARLNRLFPEPHAAFAAGLLTGSRRGIPEKLSAAFQRSGLTHIVAISGYNITIVITVIMGLLFWLPLRWRIVPAALSIIAFTILVGASASVVRAAVMGILGLLALTLGRQSTTRLTILWAALAMIAWNPKHLWYDASFQLSFAAVIGLAELSDLIKPRLTWIPNVAGMRESLEATIAAQLSSVPVALLIFGNLSLVAPLANILVAPAIPIAMLLCSLAVIVSYGSFFFGALIAAAGWAMLQWVILVAETLARLPFAALHFEQVSVWVIAAYYAGLAGVVIWHHSASPPIPSPCQPTPTGEG